MLIIHRLHTNLKKKTKKAVLLTNVIKIRVVRGLDALKQLQILKRALS